MLSYYTNPDTVFPIRQTTTGNGIGPLAAMGDLMGSLLFHCGMRRVARYQTNSNQSVYLYSFGYYTNSTTRGYFQYASHSSEGVYAWFNAYGFTEPGQQEIAAAMQQYWYAFVLNGDPNDLTGLNINYGVNTTLTKWPLFDTTTTAFMQLGSHDSMYNPTVAPQTDFHKASCDIQDAIVNYSPVVPRCAKGYSLSSTGTCVDN